MLQLQKAAEDAAATCRGRECFSVRICCAKIPPRTGVAGQAAAMDRVLNRGAGVGPQTMLLPADKDLEYMQMALEQARLAPALGEVPIGAVLVHGGEVLAQVHNFREVSQDPTAHAEIVAIREASTRLGTWRLTGTTLYVTLEPCSMCTGAIIQSRIARVVFATRDPKAGACGSVFNLPAEPRLNHRVQVTSGVLERECQDLLQAFFRRLRDDVSSGDGVGKL